MNHLLELGQPLSTGLAACLVQKGMPEKQKLEWKKGSCFYFPKFEPRGFFHRAPGFRTPSLPLMFAMGSAHFLL
jgi:hypothetical protein